MSLQAVENTYTVHTISLASIFALLGISEENITQVVYREEYGHQGQGALKITERTS